MLQAAVSVDVLLGPVPLDISTLAFIDPGLSQARRVVVAQTVRREIRVASAIVIAQVHGLDDHVPGGIDVPTMPTSIPKRRGRDTDCGQGLPPPDRKRLVEGVREHVGAPQTADLTHHVDAFNRLLQ